MYQEWKRMLRWLVFCKFFLCYFTYFSGLSAHWWQKFLSCKYIIFYVIYLCYLFHSFIDRVVEWLDEYHPGSFRQAQVSFSTRIPNAFPLGDAMTMSTDVCLYNAYGCHLSYRDVLKPPATNKGPVNGPVNDVESSTPLPSVIEEESDLNLNCSAMDTVQQAQNTKVLSPRHGGTFHLNTLQKWFVRKVLFLMYLYFVFWTSFVKLKTCQSERFS